MSSTTNIPLLTQVMNQVEGNLVVITDCEPDDYMALLAILKLVRKTGRDLVIIVSAWREQQPKAARLQTFLNREFFDLKNRIFIRLGEPSHTNYDMALTPEEIAIEPFPQYTQFDLVGNIIFQLTHPVEIFKIFREQSEFFQNSYLFTYGSFNYRVPLQRYDMTTQDIRDLFTSFKFVFYYEAFPASDPTMMEYDDLTELMRRNYPDIVAHIEWWNQRIYKEIQRDLPKLTNPSAIERFKKIASSIERYPLQFVDADCGMLATILTPQTEYVTAELTLSKDDYPTFTSIRENCSTPRRGEVCYLKTADKARIHHEHHEFYIKLLAADT